MMKSATQIFSCKMPVFILFLLHEFFLVNPFLVIYKFNQLLFRSEFQVFLKTAKNENIHHPIVQAGYFLHMSNTVCNFQTITDRNLVTISIFSIPIRVNNTKREIRILIK